MLPVSRPARGDGPASKYPPLGTALRSVGSMASGSRAPSLAGSLPQSPFSSSPLSTYPPQFDGWAGSSEVDNGANGGLPCGSSQMGESDFTEFPFPDGSLCGHDELITQFRTYISSLETQNVYLKSKLDTLHEALQKLADKVTVPEPPNYRKEDYPFVKHWRPKSATKTDAVASMTPKTGSKMDYVEDEHGNPVDDFVMEAIKQCMRGVWHELNNAGRAPKNWGAAEDFARNLLRRALYRDFWFLALCDYHWKVDSLATKCYPSWAQTYITKVSAVAKVELRDTPARSLKREHEGDIEPAKKKTKQAPVPAQPIDVDAHSRGTPLPSTQQPAAATGRAPAAPGPTLAELLVNADMAVNGEVTRANTDSATGVSSTAVAPPADVTSVVRPTASIGPTQMPHTPPVEGAAVPPVNAAPAAPISSPPPLPPAAAGTGAVQPGASSPPNGPLPSPPLEFTADPTGLLSPAVPPGQPVQAPPPATAPSAGPSLLALATTSSQNVQDKAATIAAPQKDEPKMRMPTDGKITAMSLCKVEWLATNPTAFRKDWVVHWGKQNKAKWNRLAAQKKLEASQTGNATSS